MRILVAHNYYQQPGGEDVVFEEEAKLLEARGHFVHRYSVHNDDVAKTGNLWMAANAIWARKIPSEIASIIREEKIEVAHFHNVFPRLSPAAMRMARSAGAAVVQTLHNFRALCPKADFFRDGKPCFECKSKAFASRGVLRGCYRGSRTATAVAAISSTVHRVSGTYQSSVDAYIAPTDFVKKTYLESGIRLSAVHVKPHFIDRDLGFVSDVLNGKPISKNGKAHALYVGRLSEEKGIHTLLQAWKSHSSPLLKIIGDGPLNTLMTDLPPNIQWLGRVEKDQVYKLMGEAACLILPSAGVESFGKVVVESFARGTPVICSDHGGQGELVLDGLGRRFIPGDAEDLARQVTAFFADDHSFGAMREAVRKRYLDHYTAAKNYEALIAIYKQAIQSRGHSHDDDHHDKLG